MELVCYFDYGSPYSYLAWRRITARPEAYAGATIRWVPASAGHIFHWEGGKPNAAYPKMLAYNLRDLERWAQAYGTPLTVPASFPCRTIDASRLHLVAADAGHETEAAWMAACFEAHWVHGHDLADDAVLQSLCEQTGIPGGVAAAKSPEIKGRFAAATKEAYDAGAPGVPFIVVDGEGYWGNDRLDWVEAHVSGQNAPDSARSGRLAIRP